MDCDGYYTHPTLFPDSNPYAEEQADDYFRMHDPSEKQRAGQTLAGSAESLLGRKGSMLEIGCGRGELLEGARKEGWRVFGIEPTPAFAKIAESRGIAVERRPVESASVLGDTFDVILLSAVLEHLYQPADVVRRVRHALSPGGLIFIDVPNEASLAMTLGNLYMRARGRDWCVNLSPTFPPFHVVGFTERSLRKLLGRNGFEVVRLSKPQWQSALPSPRDLWERVETTGLAAVVWLGSRVGRGDGICCWARAV